jgi:flotillin
MGFIIVALGFAMIIGGVVAPGTMAAHLILCVVGVVVVVVGASITLMSFYRRTSADVAFVRTGSGGSVVVLDGGIRVVPFLHKVLEINLRTMKLGVNPRGQNALITRDNLRANVLAQFYIRVQADTEHILNAARSLGENSVNAAETVEALVSEKLVSALRAIASQMDLFEIHTKRDEFAEKVKEHVKSDLEANGLLLESVTISELDQTDPAELSDNNVFDAQGKRKITEITAAAAVERNNLERQAEYARKLKDVETRQQILGLERQQAESESQQATEIAKVRADRDRESQEALITQQRQVELAKIEKDKQIQAQEIARQQAIEIARTQQEQAVQSAQIIKEQQIQMATVERDKSVAVAERQKQIAVAQQESARAKAEEEAFRASADREKASQQVTTVIQLAESEREANKRLIAARQSIEQDKLKAQTNADVEAYTQEKHAEAERNAATQQAEARRQLAEADAQSKEMVARGERAQQMVAVEVAREQVNVEQARVQVERQQLENRQEFAEAGIQLEVRKLTIQASRDVQMEFARAMASFLANGNMTLYGTPETANMMLDNMAKGFGLRSLVDGFVNGSGNGPNTNGMNGNGHGPLNGHAANGSHSNGNNTGQLPAIRGNGNTGGNDALGGLLGQIGSILQPAIARVTGNGTGSVSPETAEQVARSLAENPAFLAALQDALRPASEPIQAVVTVAPAASSTPLPEPTSIITAG